MGCSLWQHRTVREPSLGSGQLWALSEYPGHGQSQPQASVAKLPSRTPGGLRPVPAPGTPDCRSNDSPTRPQEPPEPGRSQHRSQEFGVTWSTAVGTDAQQALVASGMAFSLPRHLLRHRPAVPPPDWSLPQGRADHLVLSPGCAGTWQGLREHLQHQ